MAESFRNSILRQLHGKRAMLYVHGTVVDGILDCYALNEGAVSVDEGDRRPARIVFVDGIDIITEVIAGK